MTTNKRCNELNFSIGIILEILIMSNLFAVFVTTLVTSSATSSFECLLDNIILWSGQLLSEFSK